MKPASLAYPLITSCLLFSTSAQLIPFLKQRNSPAPDRQSPLMDAPGPAIPPSSPDPSGAVIADVIDREQNIGIFSSFTRDVDTVARRLEDSSQNTTVLAPENAAIMGLPRKPWQDPRDYETFGANAYDGADGESRAHKNLRRFVEAHIVPESPWREGQKVRTLAGNTVWFESKDGKKTVSAVPCRWPTSTDYCLQIQPGGVEIVNVAAKVANGEVWVLKGVLNYA